MKKLKPVSRTSLVSGSGGGVMWAPDVADRIGEMWAEGLSAAVIGTRLRLTRNQVIGIVWRNAFRRHGNWPSWTIHHERKAMKARA